MPKMDSLTHFPSKNMYNDVLCINISKVTALNVFQILIVSCALNSYEDINIPPTKNKRKKRVIMNSNKHIHSNCELTRICMLGKR